MHELQLSADIVNAAVSAAAERGLPAGNIRSISLTVGPLSCASVPTLEFCMGLVLEQRSLPDAEVRIRAVPALARCECGNTYEAEDLYAPCPECGGFDREFSSGADVIIESIEVEDEEG